MSLHFSDPVHPARMVRDSGSFEILIPLLSPRILNRGLSKATLWIVLSGILAYCAPTNAEEECLFSRIWCYECDTWSDHRCKDPFNATAYPQDLPPLKRCEGCCVKIVTNQGMTSEVVRRTCTSNLQINLFLVDHVCMLESEGKGLMCFCESDACNAASLVHSSLRLFLCAFLFTHTIYLFSTTKS